MAFFETKISHVRFTMSPFTSDQMAAVGQATLDSILDRISKAQASDDTPARPLVPVYARRKIQRGRAPVRDWFWRGLTTRSMKVKRASEDEVVLGPVNEQAYVIIKAQNAKDIRAGGKALWGASPHDQEAMQAALYEQLRVKSPVRVEMVA